MSSPEAYAIVHDYLVANWTATPLHFENDGKEVPADPVHFVMVEIFGSLFDQESIGGGSQLQNLWREEGVIYLHVLCPRGSGTLLGRQYARQLADLFRGREIGGMIFRRISLGGSEPGTDDGNYYLMTVTIDWQRDEP